MRLNQDKFAPPHIFSTVSRPRLPAWVTSSPPKVENTSDLSSSPTFPTVRTGWNGQALWNDVLIAIAINMIPKESWKGDRLYRQVVNAVVIMYSIWNEEPSIPFQWFSWPLQRSWAQCPTPSATRGARGCKKKKKKKSGTSDKKQNKKKNNTALLVYEFSCTTIHSKADLRAMDCIDVLGERQNGGSHVLFIGPCDVVIRA